jgi:NADH:ubiquinone oxidoreductase subunit E
MVAPTIDREITAVVQAAIEKHGKNYDALIPILSEINHVYGYIPGKAFHEVRQQLHDPLNQIFVSEGQLYSLASFYDMLSTKPRGEHVIKFCENAPCHVVGGKASLGCAQGKTQFKKWRNHTRCKMDARHHILFGSV